MNEIACCNHRVCFHKRNGCLLSEIAHLIQKQIPLQSGVELSLKNGDKVSGVLNEISPFHLTLELISGELYTCLISAIDAWQSIGRKHTNGLFKQSKNGITEEYALSEQLQTEATSNFPKIEETNALQSEDAAFDDETQKKLEEIDNFFDEELQIIHNIVEPDFHAPIQELKHDGHLHGKWDSIRQRYENHIQDRLPKTIVEDLKMLIQHAPILSLKKILPYFQYRSGEISDALESYKELCLISNSSDDWYNLAVIAIEREDILLACYALEQIFLSSKLDREFSEWYLYLKQIRSSKKYALLQQLFDDLKDNLQEDEEEILLETCIYLLKKMGNESIALKLVQALHQETSIQPLLEEALSYFDEVPDNHPYRDIESEMNDLQQRISDEQKKKKVVSQSTEANSEMGRPPQNERPYEKAIKIIARGEDPEKAIPYFYQAIVEQDNAKDAIKRLGAIYQKQKRQNEIISLLKKYGHLVSNEYKNNMLADVYWQTRQYKEMLEVLNKIIKGLTREATSVHRYEQMGVCYEQTGWHDKAEECYRKMIDLLEKIISDLPHNTSNTIKMSRYRQMGECYMRLRQFDEAETWFEKIIEIDENDVVARTNINLCKSGQGLQDRHPDGETGEYPLVDDIEEEREPQSLLVLYETEKQLCDLIEKVLNEKGGKQWLQSLLVLRETEKQLRRLIGKVLQEKYGKQWPEEFKVQYSEIFSNYNKVKREDIEMKNKPSSNLLDYTHLRDLFEIITRNWDTCFSTIFHKDKQYWEQCGDHIAEVRNRIAHHRSEAISQANRSRCEEICQEILQIALYNLQCQNGAGWEHLH